MSEKYSSYILLTTKIRIVSVIKTFAEYHSFASFLDNTKYKSQLKFKHIRKNVV